MSGYGIAHPKNQSIDSLMLAQRSENDPIVRWFKVWSFSDVFFFIFSCGFTLPVLPQLAKGSLKQSTRELLARGLQREIRRHA